MTLHEGEIIDTHLDSTCQLRIQFPSGTERWVGFADIATHTKPINVGDWVMWSSLGPHEVLALHGQYAWLEKVSNKRPDTALISTLTPYEAPNDH